MDETLHNEHDEAFAPSASPIDGENDAAGVPEAPSMPEVTNAVDFFTPEPVDAASPGQGVRSPGDPPSPMGQYTQEPQGQAAPSQGQPMPSQSQPVPPQDKPVPPQGQFVPPQGQAMPNAASYVPMDVPAKKRPTKMIAIIGCIVVAALVVVGFVFFQNANAQKSREDYISTMETTSFSMLNGAAEAETLSNTIVKVWNSAIFDSRSAYLWDSDIQKYYSDDFNTALSLLFSDPSTQYTVSEIESNQASVKNMMSKLSNPPEDLQNAYNTLMDLYNEYLTLTDLATSPTGSLQTFSATFHDADTNFMNYYNRLETQIPSE